MHDEIRTPGLMTVEHSFEVPLDHPQRVILGKDTDGTAVCFVRDQHLLQPIREHFVKECIGNDRVHNTRTGIEAHVYPVRTKNSLAKPVDGRGSDFSDAWCCLIKMRALCWV